MLVADPLRGNSNTYTHLHSISDIGYTNVNLVYGGKNNFKKKTI